MMRTAKFHYIDYYSDVEIRLVSTHGAMVHRSNNKLNIPTQIT